MKPLMSFCTKTILHMQNLLKSKNSKFLLVGVKGGGCNGLKYYIEPTDDGPQARDETMVVENVPIIVCGKSLMHLLGTNVYWKEDGLGARIEFENPNAKSTCGCGETFSPF